MESKLYDKDCNCPVCKSEFTTKKVRSRALRVEKREPDFNIIYKDVNPNYYYIWVCPICGYSATEREFENINKYKADIVRKTITPKWLERSFGGVRSYNEAEESFKLAILIGQLIEKPKGYMAGLCIRLAWLYREDKNPREEQFLKKALSLYETSYQTERLDEIGLDEISIAYLNGELNRQLGEYNKAIKWYAVALGHTDIKRNRVMQIKAREQWALAKEQYDESRL